MTTSQHSFRVGDTGTLPPMPTLGDRGKLGYTLIWSRIYRVVPHSPGGGGWMLGQRLEVAPSRSLGRILGLRSYFFSTLSPWDIVQNQELGAKLGDCQVQGAGGFQV